MLRWRILPAVLALIVLSGCMSKSHDTLVAPAPVEKPYAASQPSVPSEPSPTAAARIVSTFSLNPLTGWAVIQGGATSTILFTETGGTTWTALSAPAFSVDRVAFATPAHGVASGRSWDCINRGSQRPCAFSLATTWDGGATWETTWTQEITADVPSPTVFTVNLLDDQNGYAWRQSQAPGDGSLMLTHDGGRSWKTLPEPSPDVVIDGAVFVDKRQGWVVGRRCDGSACSYTVYHTVDGGSTWRQQLTVESLMRRNSSVLRFVDEDHGWLLLGPEGARCGMHGCAGALYRTVDGGKTWVLEDWIMDDHRPEGERHGIPIDIQFSSRLDGWLTIEGTAASKGGIGVTRDGGKHWDIHLPDSMPTIVSVTALDAEHAWIVGVDKVGQSVLIQTDDSATTWRAVDVGASQTGSSAN